MRATFTIDERVFNAAKARATSTGRSVDEVVEEALRTTLASNGGVDAAVARTFPTFPGGKLRPGVDIDNNAAVRDLMDLDTP